MEESLNSNQNCKFSPKKRSKKFIFKPPLEAPVFRPTDEEFKDPLKYIRQIRPIGEKSGICKIIPPSSWNTPFALNMDTLRFVPRIQRINELEARTRIKLNFNDKLSKYYAVSGKSFQVPMLEKTTVDLYTLHRKVKECGGVDIVNKEKKWADIALSMDFTCKSAPTTLKNHYDTIIHPFLISQAIAEETDDNKENNAKCENGMIIDNGTGEGTKNPSEHSAKTQGAMRELRSLKFLGAGPKMAVCDGGMKGNRTRGKRISYEFDPLSKFVCMGCKKNAFENTPNFVQCTNCSWAYHPTCLVPPLPAETPTNWKCPKCVAADGYKPLEEFGFAQAEREYSLNDFKNMANEFKTNYFNMPPEQVDESTVEQEFWKVVTSIDESVTVEYGADLHVIEHGSGFPRVGQECVDWIDEAEFEKFANSPWNLNNLPVLEESVLRHISADISGMKIPWMYAGMCFATFCWHNEDHWSYSINYLHLGEAKTWYGVPGLYAELFEEAMKKAAPELFESQPDLLHQLVTIMNPNDIMAAGVPVFRTDQRKGEFVITFPRAYHAGFNQGFNFAEACNFAPADWLNTGRECILHYAQLKRTCVFSHDELVCKMASTVDSIHKRLGYVLMSDMALMVESEKKRRTRAFQLGVRKAEMVEFDQLPDDERQCNICNTTLYLSAISCSCNKNILVCLDHINELCNCNSENYILKYRFKMDLLHTYQRIISSKIGGFSSWSDRVHGILKKKHNKAFSLHNLTELLVEAKDKQFPQNHVIDLLEYHVRRSIECSALAKALVAISNSKDENPSKVTIEDLELFNREIENLPCVIAEEMSIKALLVKAKQFQMVAQRIIDDNDIENKSCILPYINMGRALNLDSPQLQCLERKLAEFEWIDQVTLAISSGANGSVTNKLSEAGKQFDTNPLITKTMERLEEYIDSLPITITSCQTIADVENIDFFDGIKNPVNQSLAKGAAPPINQDVLPINRTVAPSRTLSTPPPSNITSPTIPLRNVEKIIGQVIKGQVVLYLQDLEELILQAKQQTPKSSLIKPLEDGVSVVRNWEMAAKSIFLKKGDSLGLMDALWPRRFVSRHLYFAKLVSRSASAVESLVDRKDVTHYRKNHFQRALRQEFLSLSQLRIDNLRKMDSEDFGASVQCICGNAPDNSAIVCELCLTAMHLKCFTEIDKNCYPMPQIFDPGFRNRRICGMCKRTNRPPIKSVQKLIDTIDRLAIKIPECYALKYTMSRVQRWREQIKGIINPEQLEFRSSEIVNFFRKFHHKKFIGELPFDVTMPDSHLIIGSNLGISRTMILNLKEELVSGNRLEITPPELDEIWNILNPLPIHYEVESGFHNYICYPLKGDSRRGPPLPLPIPATIPKKTIKRKSLTSTSSNASADPPTGKKVKKRRRQVFTKARLRKTSSSPSSSNYAEEHEPEANCAAPTCLKPGDASVDWVMCDGVCKQWFHMKCVDLDNKNVNEDFEYVCANCVCNRVCDRIIANTTKKDGV